MTLIPDPIDLRSPAIVSDERGVRLAPAVLFVPVVSVEAPTLAELDAGQVVGYMTN